MLPLSLPRVLKEPRRLLAGLMIAIQAASPIAASASQYIQMVPIRDLKVVNGDVLSSTYAPAGAEVTTATAGNAVLKATPSTVSFGTLTVGQTSPQQTVTFSNLGGGTATLGTLSTNKQFSVSSACNGVVLPSLSTCQVKVAFNPTQVAAGGLLGTLVVPFTAGTASSQALIGMTGVSLMPLTDIQATEVTGFTGSDPALTITADGTPQIAFGETLSATGTGGSVSAAVTKTFTISSSGSVPVTFSGATVTGDPSYTVSTTCPSVIPVGQSCTVSVTFDPTSPGTKTAVLTVDTSSFAGNTLSVNLQGQGVSTSRFSLSSSTLAFGAVAVGQSATRTLSVLNTGTDTLANPVLSTTSAYLSATHNCPSILTSGSSCNVSVVFTPATPAVLNAQVQVTFDNAGSLSASTTGEGMGPMLSVDAASHNFGTVVVGQTANHTYTLSNDGNAPALLAFGATTGPVALAGDCPISPATLSAGAVCHTVLTYSPTTAGTLSGSFTVASALNSLNLGYTGTAIVQPIVTTSTATVDFGTLLLGDTRTLAVQVSNSGTTTLGTPSIWVDGSDFTQVNNCATGMTAGQSCTVNVSVTPSVRKVYSSSLHVNYPYATAKTVALKATETSAALAVDFPDQSFGAVNINETGSLSYVLTNNGEVAAALTFGALPSLVTQADTCGTSLAAGANCTVTLTYAPVDTSSLTGSLTISSPTSSTSLNFTGNGVATIKFDLSATALNFGSVTQGSSATSNFSVYNGGSTPLTNPVVSGTGTGYSAVHNCGATLHSGYSCQVSVTYAPTVTALQTGSVSIQFDNASAKTVSLSGTGLDPNVLKLSASAIDLGNVTVGSSGSLYLMVMNQGVTTLASPSISVSGAGFSATHNCGSSITGGTSCSISTTYSASVMGAATGALLVTTTGGTATIGLSAFGVQTSGALSTSSLPFGTQPSGLTSAAQSVTLTNTGNMPLTVSDVSVNSDFSATHNCSASLAAGESCVANVALTPSVVGSVSGTLAFTTGAGTKSVSLTGTGLGGVVAYQSTSGSTVSSFAFGTSVGQSDAAQSLVVKNTGNVDLVFTGSGVTVPAPFSIAGMNTCASATVIPGGTCSVSLTFTPTAVQIYSGVLSLTSNGFNVGTVALSGTGSPALVGQQEYTTPGTFTWVAPAGVTSVSAVAVGGGGKSAYNIGAGGGGLGWRNNIAVVPGTTYTVVVGAANKNSYFIDSTVVMGGGAANTMAGTGGTFVGDGGGNGGTSRNTYYWSSGAGAGGYTGTGGNGVMSGSGLPGVGGGGGGGGYDSFYGAGGGGGVGLQGAGANGVAGISSGGANGGGGGSGGQNGGGASTTSAGGRYGGGGGAGAAGTGAVRIIWGAGRAFPSTLTTDR